LPPIHAIPVKKSSAPEKLNNVQASLAAHLNKGKKILVAEDQFFNLVAIEAAIDSLGLGAQYF